MIGSFVLVSIKPTVAVIVTQLHQLPGYCFCSTGVVCRNSFVKKDDEAGDSTIVYYKNINVYNRCVFLTI